ncbi:DUF3192 domain-containing protein [Pseudoalteromonas phenolica]|uniref:DUF3192 domain-containing protein n=1 Tax=Pseudoalteromonas phenolica TaxID=161398 RepID=A0A0S2K8U1_9GAMM|nr:DUF3192 domain-containing protein [Pseudoalteromonas phenolica]ALO44649.1 hypothetical protein PP2015_4182 [Pseudoalteromonas phenolica]MBE0357683.1 hypothetical protein [Pseudoalteromonas phenolica O-BC30]TMO55688.1 DUF3192 domain-containing protein [Pseudoalteromonas phenolica]|tara:strand:+ start:108 stop:497 length:390 start_codon:yes stop_codon:yes gene_type:complete
MIKKVLQYIILGLAVYASIVMLVINFYKDDPQAMIWQDREAFNNRFISKLDESEVMPLEEVLETLGSPDLTYVSKKSENVYQIVYYRTQLVKSDGITTQDECTGLLFKNGKLLVWGENASLEYAKLNGE